MPTITIPDVDAVCDDARARAARFMRRETLQVARFSGLSDAAVRSLRDARDDQYPGVAKVALSVVGGRAIGRSFEEVCDYLHPIHEAAGIDPFPITEVVGTIGIERAATEVLRETHELLAALIQRIKGGIDATELPVIEKEANDIRTAAARVIREAQAAVVPARGKKFQK